MSNGKAGRVYEAIEGFVCEIDGERYIVVRRQTRVDGSHKLVTTYPQHFEPVADNLSYQVEAATDDPGEQRIRTAPAKTASGTKGN